MEILSTSHYNGEVWGLEIIPEKGTFLTSADDGEFFEYSIKDRALIKSGKFWDASYFDGASYETKK